MHSNFVGRIIVRFVSLIRPPQEYCRDVSILGMGKVCVDLVPGGKTLNPAEFLFGLAFRCDLHMQGILIMPA